MNLDGLDLTDSQWRELFHVDPVSQLAEAADAAAYFDGFDGRVPAALREQLSTLTTSLERLVDDRSEAAAHER
jgi:phosphoenolpyruvate carboxykinase (GTP)